MMTIGLALYLAYVSAIHAIHFIIIRLDSTPSPTLINHSCNPNCIAVFDGHILRIRTIRNVLPGDQVIKGVVNVNKL